MFEWIKKPFGLDYETKYQKQLETYIASLPIPPVRIVVCSRRYKPQEFNCEATVYTPDLLAWLEDHYSRCSVSFYAQTLLSWFPKVNLQDSRYLYLPIELLRAIDGYESRIINSCRSDVICGLCGDVFGNVEQEYENTIDAGSRYEGTAIWQCPNGHEIYRHNFKYHVNRGI